MAILPKTTWNYRVMRHDSEDPLSFVDKSFFLIHEVYYNEEGIVVSWSDSDKNNYSFRTYGETVNELKDEFENMKKAFLLPVLDFKTGLEIGG